MAVSLTDNEKREVLAADTSIYIIETKGLEDLHVPLKMDRLGKWCNDINASQKKIRFDFVFVDEEDFERYKPDSFDGLVKSFRKYKE